MKLKLTLLSMMLFVGVAHGESSADLNPNIFGNQVVNQPADPAPQPDPNDPANRYNNYDGRGAGRARNITNQAPTETNKAPNESTINPGANTGAQSQSSGSGINAAVGAALIAACLAPCPKCMMPLCAMGAMALMQSGHDAGAAGQSYNVADVTKNDTTSNNPTGNPDGTGGFDKDKLDLAKAKLGEAGYTVTENGVKFPDGSMHSSTDLISPSAMASAGLDPSASKDAQSLVDSIIADAAKEGQSGARVSGVGLNGGGGGGGGSGSASGDGGASDSSYGSGSGYGKGLGADDKRKLIAGKTVMFDGEPIGVRGNNIFDMIHTCYEKKRASNQFIDTAGNDAIMPTQSITMPALPARMPASQFKGSNR